MSDTLPTSSYPQHSNQSRMWLSVGKTGGVVLCDNRSVLEVAMAAFTTSEWKLARQLYATLQPGDVVADSAYGTYVDLALVHSANADAVFRKHHARHCDFRRGKKLGIGDHIVQWQRPERCPQSMTRRLLSITSKHRSAGVHLLIQRPGFRPKEIILVTTLVDPKRYPKAKLAHLYQLRWQAARNFKHLKTTLKMEMILPNT